MTSKSEKDKTKQLQDKCQSVLNGLLRDEDNKYCVDCDSKGPRWASWNIGVFLCIRCAGIHRNLGVHISKVKSVNLDTWTPEQVVSLQQMGNSRARAVYEANLPDNFRRPQNDSSLETFIRAKYEHKKYIAREWVPPVLPKVNWEKEIDDEIEKQKRKKKTTVEKKIVLGNVEVPQLPKPKNPSPKPSRNSANIASVENKDSSKKDSDLLGLQNGDDSFSGFLSAAAASADVKKPEDLTSSSASVPAADIRTEEESFFNQTAPTEKERVKLTKDSILALYGSAPSAQPFQAAAAAAAAPQLQQQMLGGGFGGFPAAPSAQQSFGQSAQNGMGGAFGVWPQQQTPPQVWNKQQPVAQFPATAAAPQFGSAPQFPPQQQQNGPLSQFTAAAAFANQMHATPPTMANQFAAFASPPPNAFAPATATSQKTPNPFFAPGAAQPGGVFGAAAPAAGGINLQQQFDGLTLNGAAPPLTANNIWQ